MIELKYKGEPYGELEVMRKDFANVLRALNFEVVEDVDMPNTEDGIDFDAVKKYCEEHELTLVILWIDFVPFYYGVRELWDFHLLSHLSFIFKIRIAKPRKRW